jgi:uncharacterized protein
VKRAVATATCGPYEIVAPAADALFEDGDGSIELRAELSYVVRFRSGAPRDVLKGALSVPKGGREGKLRFQNFVGLSKLGGRRLTVRSNRLDADAVAGMLDEVCRHLASLSFYVDTPTQGGYMRVPDLGPEVLYHSFAFLRDCLRYRRPHDLAGALQRILAQPLLTLRSDRPQRVPLGAATGVDADTLAALQSEPEPLQPVTEAPVAFRPLADALGGALPTYVKTSRTLHSTDNAANRFVLGALLTMADLLRRFEGLVRAEGRVSSALNAGEAAALADDLERLQRHPSIERLTPLYEPPLHSTALRGRSGYRDLLAVWTSLIDHASRAEAHDAQPLLELRETATIYEYWCFFRIADAVRSVLGDPLEVSRFAAETNFSKVPWGYSFRWEAVELVYNRTFKRSTSAEGWPGRTSYGRSMRPDATLLSSSGLHLFDAKLRVDLDQNGDRFKSDDLHKMHAYRDALGATSVWVIYPGRGNDVRRFQSPVGVGAFQGVGAVPLHPGGESPLEELVSELLDQP